MINKIRTPQPATHSAPPRKQGFSGWIGGESRIDHRAWASQALVEQRYFSMNDDDTQITDEDPLNERRQSC